MGNLRKKRVGRYVRVDQNVNFAYIRANKHYYQKTIAMTKHKHEFVETYSGLVGFGADRKTDESTVWYFLQKFSDDALMETLLPRLADLELSDIFSLLSKLVKKHLSEAEYHRLFLKDHEG
jgi:hypothetical protein